MSDYIQSKLELIDNNDAVLRALITFMETAKVALKYADMVLYREARLSVSKLAVLVALTQSDDGMSPSELSKWTRTERHNVTTLIRRMKKDGLITSERDNNNGRRVRVTLQKQGREVLIKIKPAMLKMVKDIMLSVTEADAVLLETTMNILMKNIHNAFINELTRK